MSTGVVFQSTLQKACKSKGHNYDFPLHVLIYEIPESMAEFVNRLLWMACACAGRRQ
ncbi:hypothetical protein I79_011478 [Cricetulus griseus]|uniref:Uncharacterized protein n=1 Tax=Cricetulus griseus TaxID=10029 RepID=G3HL92_CRIGR|nr:hypothetical protein I79_011478 [Cricetulus griseus]